MHSAFSKSHGSAIVIALVSTIYNEFRIVYKNYDTHIIMKMQYNVCNTV